MKEESQPASHIANGRSELAKKQKMKDKRYAVFVELCKRVRRSNLTNKQNCTTWPHLPHSIKGQTPLGPDLVCVGADGRRAA